MANTKFIVKHKQSGLFFAGFSADHSPLFGGKAGARKFDTSLEAGAQAILLRRDDLGVQVKAVRA